MVAIDRHDGLSEGVMGNGGLAGFLGAFLRDLAYPYVVLRGIIGRNTAATAQRRRVALAEKTSKRAAAAADVSAAVPALLTASELMARLHPLTAPAVAISNDVTHVRQDADMELDWVLYELAAIRRDIADAMPGS